MRDWIRTCCLTSIAYSLLALPAKASETFDAGVKAFNKSDFNQAYAHFSKVVKAEPSNPNAYYYAGLCLQRLNNLPAATTCYNQVIKLSPDSAAAGFSRTALENLAKQASAAAAPKTVAAVSPGAATAAGSSRIPAVAVNSDNKDDDSSGLQESASFYFVREGNGHMSVDLMLNGRPVKAWFDTGADAFFYRDQLQDAGVDCHTAKAAGQTHGWAGKAVNVSMMPAEIKIGTLVRKINITMEDSTTSLGKNLIGQSILRGYQYEIDDKAGRVDLRKSIATTAQAINSLYDVPCVLQNGRDIVPVEINHKKVQAFIDTGSAYTIIDAKTAERLGIESTGSQQMVGVGGELTVGTATTNIRFGPIDKDFTVRIGGTAGCCIGQDFMSDWRCKVDRQRNLMRFFH